MKNANLLFDLMDILSHGYANIKRNSVTDFELLEQYKNGTAERSGTGFVTEMEVLCTLERLGFPMNTQGTIFFKDLVVKIMDRLNSIAGPEDLASCDELCAELANHTSTFYHELARNDLDIGIRTFHELVSRAYNAVDPSTGDPLLVASIASKMSQEGSYPECAFVVGSHVRNAMRSQNAELEMIPLEQNITRG